MENSDLLRRAEDLQRRCEKNGVLTATHFLTPAERFQLERWAKTQPGCRLVFSGGHPDCERTVGFFLPDWLDEEWLPLDEQICALELSAPFGNPGHRDYLGALLGMGIGRERLGDIWVHLYNGHCCHTKTEGDDTDKARTPAGPGRCPRMKGRTMPLQPHHNDDPLFHASCSRHTDPLPTLDTPELPHYSSVAPTFPEPRKTLCRSVQRPAWAVPPWAGPPHAQNLGPSVPRLLAPTVPGVNLYICGSVFSRAWELLKGKADTLLDSLHCPRSMAVHRRDLLCG